MATSDNIENKQLKEVNDAFSQLDDNRADSLAAILEFKKSWQESMKDELERLIKKYGENHDRVTRLQDSLESNQQMIDVLTLQAQLNAKPEKFQATWWRLQGFVADSNGNPGRDIVVNVKSGQSTKTNAVSVSSSTNEDGFYSITIKNPPDEKTRVKTFLLSVTDKSKRKKYDYSKTVTPVAGIIDVEDIFLP